MSTNLRKRMTLVRNRDEMQLIDFPNYPRGSRGLTSSRRLAPWQRPLVTDEVEISGGEDVLVPIEIIKISVPLEVNHKRCSDRRLTPHQFSLESLED